MRKGKDRPNGSCEGCGKNIAPHEGRYSFEGLWCLECWPKHEDILKKKKQDGKERK